MNNDIKNPNFAARAIDDMNNDIKKSKLCY